MLDRLERPQRLTLLKFVCSFAWADLEIRDEERAFVSRLVDRLGLGEDEAAQVQRWLASPPVEDTVDPSQVPREHREIFLETIKGVIRADGEISEEERDHFAIFDELLA